MFPPVARFPTLVLGSASTTDITYSDLAEYMTTGPWKKIVGLRDYVPCWSCLAPNKAFRNPFSSEQYPLLGWIHALFQTEGQ